MATEPTHLIITAHLILRVTTNEVVARATWGRPHELIWGHIASRRDWERLPSRRLQNEWKRIEYQLACLREKGRR